MSVANLVVFGGVFVRKGALEVIHWHNRAVFGFCELFFGQTKVKPTCFRSKLTCLRCFGVDEVFGRQNRAVWVLSRPVWLQMVGSLLFGSLVVFIEVPEYCSRPV